MEKIHNRKKRMPVILSHDDQNDWIKFNMDPEAFRKSFPQEEMEAWTVSKLISSRDKSNNVPEVLSHFQYPELKMLDDLNI